MQGDTTNDPIGTVEDEADLNERAEIAKKNIPFLDDAAARATAADQLHPGKINPSSREVDDARARQAQADEAEG